MRGAAMSFSAAVHGVIVFIVAVVCGQDVWRVTYASSHICAPIGSTVEMQCSYTYPHAGNKKTAVKNTFWFTQQTNGIYRDLTAEEEYFNRVTYKCPDKDCTLNISDLKESDSKVYKFRFTTNHTAGSYTGLPGVRLSVTDIWVNVKRSEDYNPRRIVLTCNNNCGQPSQVSYSWFKNDVKLHVATQTLSLISSDATNKYHCAIQGHEHVPSPAVYPPKVPILSVKPSKEIAEGTPVTLTCSSDANPGATYTWYRANKNVQPFRKEPQIVFSSIQASDAGWYNCTAENDLGKTSSSRIYINVMYRPKTCTVSVTPSGEVEEGKPVDMTCMSDANPAAEYTWYKENKILPDASKPVYHFHAVSSDDRGSYYCESKNQYGHLESSPLFLDVLYAPKVPSVSITPGEIMEGSSVTLTCSSDANPAAQYTWYRKDEHQPLGVKENFIFKSIDSSESGEYYCTALNSRGKKTSSRVNIDVKYAPRFLSVSLSPSGKIAEGSSVTLTCSSDANPAADYNWYKEGKDSPEASGKNFTIRNIQHEHSGDYYCKVQNKIGRHNATVSVIVVAGPSKLAVIGTTLFIFLIIFIFVFLLVRNRRSSIPPSPKPVESPRNIEQCQRSLSESQEDVQYASIQFLRKQTDPVYANFKPAKPRTSDEEEEEEQDVEYAAVKFASTSCGHRTEGPETGEDLTALYSVVNKFQRPKLNS